MLSARQIDARVRQMAAYNIPPEQICARLRLSWQRVARVLGTAAVPAQPPEDAPVPDLAPAPVPEAADAVEDAARFLRAKGHQVVRLPGGQWLLNDRDATADDVVAKAERIRARMAGAAA